MKQCTKCKVDLISGVNIYPYNELKYKYICKKCSSEQVKQWRRNNPEKAMLLTKVSSTKYRKNNPEKMNSAAKRYQQKISKQYKEDVKTSEDRQFIKEQLVDRDELYSKVMKKMGFKT